jgi:hypothetical protein
MGQFCARARKRADLSSVSIKDEIAALLARHGITAAGFRLGYILIHAELERMICSGPLRGRQHTYALLEERVPRAASLGETAALHAAADRLGMFLGARAVVAASVL